MSFLQEPSFPTCSCGQAANYTAPCLMDCKRPDRVAFKPEPQLAVTCADRLEYPRHIHHPDLDIIDDFVPAHQDEMQTLFVGTILIEDQQRVDFGYCILLNKFRRIEGYRTPARPGSQLDPGFRLSLLFDAFKAISLIHGCEITFGAK